MMVSFTRNSFEDHLNHTAIILKKAQHVGLTLSKTKCKFGYQDPLLGYLVGVSGVRTNPSKISNIVDWPIPSDSTGLSRFIGVIQYYRRFIENCSELLVEMTTRLSKVNTPFSWTIEANNCFLICKFLLTTAPILVLPDFSKPFVLFTDASDVGIGVGIGAVLAQTLDRISSYSHRRCATTLPLLTYTLYHRDLAPFPLQISDYLVSVPHLWVPVEGNFRGSQGLNALISPSFTQPVLQIPTSSIYIMRFRIGSNNLACFYLPPSLPDDDVITLLDSMPLLPDTILCGDFNARMGDLTGDRATKLRGRLLRS
jgi:hypothetical protein